MCLITHLDSESITFVQPFPSCKSVLQDLVLSLVSLQFLEVLGSGSTSVVQSNILQNLFAERITVSTY